MKDFKKLVRDTELSENPLGTWQKAKNILKTKGFKSISNEYSNKDYSNVPGVIIGVIETNIDTVFFLINSAQDSEIGRIRNITGEYETIIKSKAFNFKYEYPIEGIYIYNYKGELIVVFCDGVDEGANTPKIINLDNPGVRITESKFLFPSTEINKLELFPNVKEGDLIIQPLDSGNINGDIAYVTYAYVFEDNSTTSYFSINNIAYLSEGFDPVDKKGMRLKFTNLDNSYKKLKLGIVIKEGNELVGYESYDINYEGTSKDIDITSLNNFTISTAESIIIEKTIFRRIETITKDNNQVFVGNYKVREPIPLQKYFLNLKLEPVKYLSNDNSPSLLPDEVYAIYGEVQFKDGSYSEAFHIPGREAEGNELNNLTLQEISDYNLNWTSSIINGNFKNFHIFNNGVVNSNQTIAKFGFFQNEEKYPNIPEYNASIDYDGTPIDNGRNLQNRNILYHRMPSIKAMATFDGGNYLLDSNNLEDKQFYKLGIRVTNFAEAFPDSIKELIQGYRISFVKRTFGNSYVAGNYVMVRRGEQSWTQAGVDTTWEYHDFNLNSISDETYFGNLNINFSKGRLLSNELFKLRPTLDLTYLQTNYLFSIENKGIKQYPLQEDQFGRVKSNVKYIQGNNFISNTQYHEEGINIDMIDENYLNLTSSTNAPSARYLVANVTVYNHKTNLYAGFKSNSLVIMGKTSDLTNIVTFKGGDVFNNNEIDVVLHTAKRHRFSTSGNRQVVWRYSNFIKIKGLYSPLNNTQLFNNRDTLKEDVKYIGDNEKSYRIDEVFLNSQDYTFEVKGEEDLSTINDINTILTYDINTNFISHFPYRVHRGIKIPKETLSTTSLRTFLSDAYYEMTNNKGVIISLNGKDRALFIQHEFTLFAAFVKDKLKTDNLDAYLGSSELFERPPEELLPAEKGTIGCVSKFSCKIIKGFYIVINALDGQIYLIDNSVKEITANGNRNWFNENWDIGLDYYKIDELTGLKKRIDNPFCSVGYTVGYDEKNNRLLFTKRYFQLKNPDLLNSDTIYFNGQIYKHKSNNSLIDFETSGFFENKSCTFSYSLDGEGGWICEHDYTPNFYYYTNNKHYSIKNRFNNTAIISEHNDITSVGTFYGVKYRSYIDLPFTDSNNISKLLQSIQLRTTVKKDNIVYKEKTITGIMIYNNHQCSGEIELTPNILTRNNEGLFFVNEFRDKVINTDQPIIKENGEVNLDNLEDKIWFEMSNFIGTFFVVRLIMDNVDENNVLIHEVNTVNIKS